MHLSINIYIYIYISRAFPQESRKFYEMQAPLSSELLLERNATLEVTVC